MTRHVWLVARREIQDLLRDRRSVFLALMCALTLPPLLAIGFQIVMAVAARNYEVSRFRAAFPSARSEPAAVSTGTVWVRELGSLPPACLAHLSTDGLALVEAPPGADPTAAINAGLITCYLDPSRDLERLLGDVAALATVTVLYDSDSPRSYTSQFTVWSALQAWRGELLEQRLAERGLEQAFVQPLRIDTRSTHPYDLEKARRLAPLQELSAALPIGSGDLEGQVARARMFVCAVAALILCATALLSCGPPAISLGVLERERGTLEALLLTPAPREAIALGKTLALSLSGLILTALTALSSALTMAPVVAQAVTQTDSALAQFLRVMEIEPGSIVCAVLLLIPYVVFAAAGTLAVSATVRSEREAGYVLGPILIVALLLMFYGCLPPEEQWTGLSETTLCLLPFCGMTTLVRAVLAGSATGLMVTNAFLSTLLCALLAARHLTRVYGREEAVARAGASPGFGVFERHNQPDARGWVLPTPAQALFLGVLVLTLQWTIGASLMALDVRRGLVATDGLVLFAVPLAYSMGLGLTLAPTFGLLRPGWRGLTAGLLLGLGTPALAVDVFALQARFTGALTPLELEAYQRAIEQLTEGGLLQALLLLGIAPGLLEELVFRGFVLTGTRRWGPAAAVGASAILFSLAHIDPARFGVTGLLGVLLGVLALRSGSVVPGMLAHALHNSAAGLGGLEWLGRVGLMVDGRPSWTLRALSVGLIAGALLLARPRAPTS